MFTCVTLPSSSAHRPVSVKPNACAIQSAARPTSSYENFLGLEQKHLQTPETRYERSQLIQNTYQGRPGALWEFTHIPEPDEGTLKRHVIDQAFVAADGTEYAILAAGRAELWDANKDVVFSTALNTFRVS